MSVLFSPSRDLPSSLVLPLFISNQRWAPVLLICWSTVFLAFALVGLFSCRLLEIAPLPNGVIDAVSGAPLPTAMFGLIFYKDVFQDIGVAVDGQEESFFGRSCVTYPVGGAPMDKDSPNVLDMICAYTNLASLLLGVVLILFLCLTLVIDRCSLTAYRFAGFGFMLCTLAQPFTFLIWSGEVCDNNVVLEQAGLSELYSDECTFGASYVYIMLASIGWFFSFIFCQIIGRDTNGVKNVFADGNSKKDVETEPDEDENYQAVAHIIGYDDDETVEVSGAADGDALSRLLDTSNNNTTREQESTAREHEADASSKMTSSMSSEDRLVRKGSQSYLRTLSPCGPSVDWLYVDLISSCDPEWGSERATIGVFS
jgi:hypothetical protein